MADKHGVPRRMFLNLIRQESGFNPRAKSPSGAIGLTQLMPATAKALGVNPHDPIENLKGGAVYLAGQLKAYGGSCKRAGAAFNGGPRAVPYLESIGWRRNPNAPRSAWSNQTAEYVQIVCKGV